MGENDEMKPKAQAEGQLQAALADEGVPKLYGNSFVISISNADASLLLQNHGRPAAVISLSHTLAKTLAKKLGYILTQIESKTGKEIPTTDQVDAGLVAAKEGDDDSRTH